MYLADNFTQESSDDSLNRDSIFSDCTGTKPKFKFPPPPRLTKSANNSYCSTASDSSNNEIFHRSFNTVKKKRHKSSFAKKLPPLGIYWDIENCHVPKGKSASDVVQRIREVFLENYRESEFIVVCDVKKESPQIIQELHDSQVNLIHVSSTSKNAADEKLRQSLRRFAEVHSAPSGIVLISGDINFAADLSDLRYRKKIRVILVHNVNVAEALILCANEHHSFTELMKHLPENRTRVNCHTPALLTVSNLPLNFERKRIRNRLRMLVENCGGKILNISSENGLATIRFGNVDAALRAQRRIQGEDVFGSKIKVLSPSVRNFSGRRVKNEDVVQQSSWSYSNLPPPPGFNSQEYGQGYNSCGQFGWRDSKRQTQDLNGQPGMENVFRPIKGTNMPNVSPMDISYDQGGWGGGRRHGDRRPRTPQEQANVAICSVPSRIHKISGSSEYSDDGKMCYSSESDGKNTQTSQPVNLIISNLDPTIGTNELRRLLTNMFKEYAMILSLNVIVPTDGIPIANIKLSSQQEAQFAISQLHRQKLGQRRIVISYSQNNSPDPEQLRAMVIRLLQEVPDKGMPLFKLFELLESRYHCVVSVSEVNKLKDICKITDDLGSRIISLTQEVKSSPPPNLSRTFVPYCTVHCPNGLQNRGWGELNTIQAPNVMMSLKLFANKLIGLLKIHLGCMPLLSFQICYEQEYREPLPMDESGVPLEHLIACVPNMEIKYVGPNKNIKIVKYDETKNVENDEDAVLKTVPPSLAPNINLLCRELVDLLKTMDRCQLLLSKFIPAYHHHFGRQCRMANYGYTKLLDLFESISHVVQIMGDGTRRVITLSHSAQMRRFTSDLLRVLKVQPSKQIGVMDFPSAYEKVMNKPFNAVEYGLCTFEDLLREVPENMIVVSKNDEVLNIAIPKKEQTAEEIMRTKQFASEVIDLLRHSPYYTMLFHKFVPAYHRHYGHQCKLTDYGFTKLIELFEAIPDVVKIDELPDGERTVSLTLEQSLKMLGSQLVQIIKASKQSAVLLDDIPRIYLSEYGFPLEPQLYECDSIMDMVRKLSDFVQLINGNAGPLLVAIDMDTVPNTLRVRSWALLLNPPHYKDLDVFRYEYQCRYNSSFMIESMQQIGNVISISTDTNVISLTALYVLAAQIYHVIYSNGGSVSYNNLEKLYFETFQKPLKLSNHHIYSVDEFYNNFSLLFFIRGSKKKSMVVLNRNLAEHLVPLPTSLYKWGYTAASKKEAISWPLPVPETAQGAVKKVSPPKPDTPPTPGTSLWNNSSASFASENNDLNLCIDMPISLNPKLMGDPKSLISPARYLFVPEGSPWRPLESATAPPDPSELPMPNKLISKGGVSDESQDSGVNIKLDTSPSDNENKSAENQLHGYYSLF